MIKRNLVIVAVVAIAISLTGVTMGIQSNHKPNHPKKLVTIVPDSSDPNKTVSVETTEPSASTAPVSTSTPGTDSTASTAPATPTVTSDPLEGLHQTVISQATATAQLISPQDVQGFIDVQWACISNSLGPNNENLNAMSTWLEPKTNPDGSHTYNYFRDRGCWVLSRTV